MSDSDDKAKRGLDALFEAMRGLGGTPGEAEDLDLDDLDLSVDAPATREEGVVTPEQFEKLLRKELGEDAAPPSAPPTPEKRAVKPEVQKDLDALTEAIRRSLEG
jgi:hypothetical protein